MKNFSKVGGKSKKYKKRNKKSRISNKSVNKCVNKSQNTHNVWGGEDNLEKIHNRLEYNHKEFVKAREDHKLAVNDLKNSEKKLYIARKKAKKAIEEYNKAKEDEKDIDKYNKAIEEYEDVNSLVKTLKAHEINTKNNANYYANLNANDRIAFRKMEGHNTLPTSADLAINIATLKANRMEKDVAKDLNAPPPSYPAATPVPPYAPAAAAFANTNNDADDVEVADAAPQGAIVGIAAANNDADDVAPEADTFDAGGKRRTRTTNRNKKYHQKTRKTKKSRKSKKSNNRGVRKTSHRKKK